MPRILKVDRPADYMSFIGVGCSHPLVGVVDYGEISPVPHSLNNYGVYGLFMHSDIPDGLTYGCGGYDYRSGTLICVAPGQIGGKEDNGERIHLDGWALLFHPDLLKGTHLENSMRRFSFFDYRVNEALHMSEAERDTMSSIMAHIRTECEAPADVMQNQILVSYIDVLLNLCERFYNRQFRTRKLVNSDVLARFNTLLYDYFESGAQMENGLPGMHYFAEKLNMSPNYFSDLVKRSTGNSAGYVIREYLVRLAQNKLKAGGSVAQVAYSLGFEYPQHFTRMFKRQTGITPREYLMPGDL